jgi:ligand-binding SRPBCC domain-containing protein
MATAQFQQEIIIQAPVEQVLGFMAVMENHQQIHPLVVDIRLLNTTAAPDGVPIRHYAIRDRMRYRPFTLQFTYHTAFQVRPGAELILDAAQFPRIRLHNIVRFLPEGTSTCVTEQVNIQAPRLLMATVFEEAQRLHRDMLLNLKKCLE